MKSYQIGKQKFTEDKLKNMSGTDANALYYATHQGNKKANTMAFNPGSYVEPDIKTEPTKEEKDQLLRQIQQIRKNMNEPKTVPVLNKPEAKKTVSYVSQQQKEEKTKDKYALKKSLEEFGNNPMLNGSASFSNSIGDSASKPLDYYMRRDLEEESRNIKARGQGMSAQDNKRLREINDILNGKSTPEKWVDDNTFIQKALDPNYKLTEDEKKRAKQIIRDYENKHANDANPNATELVFDEEHPDGYMKPLAELSEEEKAEQENIYALRDKISKGESALIGAMRSTPGVAALERKGGDYWKTAEENAQRQNPLSYYGGLFGNGILMNAVGQGLLGDTKYGEAVKNAVGVGKEGISEGSNVVRNVIADALMDAPVDLATDTIPELLYDIADDKSGKDIAKNLLANIALNTGMNVGASVLGNLDDIRLLQKSGESIPNTRGRDYVPDGSLQERIVGNVSSPTNNVNPNSEVVNLSNVITANSDMDIPHQIAARYAQAFSEFDTYGYMDDIQEMDGFIEKMADDIANGRDLSEYRRVLEDALEEAPDAETAEKMQTLISDIDNLSNQKTKVMAEAASPKRDKRRYYETRNMINNKRLDNGILFDNEADKKAYIEARKRFAEANDVYDKLLDTATTTDEIIQAQNNIEAAYRDMVSAASKGFENDKSNQKALREVKKNFAERVKGTVINVPDSMRNEQFFLNKTLKQINDQYTTLGNNVIKFSKNSGTPIDSIWNEIVEASGNALPADTTNPVQMIEQLNDYVMSLKVDGKGIERVPADIARYVPEEYWDRIYGLGSDAGRRIDSIAESATTTAPIADEAFDSIESAPLNESGMSKHMRGEGKMQMEGVSDEVKQDFIDDPQLHEQLSNAETKLRAEDIYNNSENPEAEFRIMLSKHDPAALPLGHQLAKDYSAAGNHEMAAQIYRDMGEQLTKSGQFSQAAILTMIKDDPLTALAYFERQLDKLNAEGAEKYGKKWKDFILSDEEKKLFDNIKPGDRDAIKAAMDKIGARIEKEYPSTFWEKVLEFRRVAMLFNLRTILRNYLANPATAGLRYVADRIDGLGQYAAHLMNPEFERTQAVLGSNLETRKLAKQMFESDKVQSMLQDIPGRLSEIPRIGNYAASKQIFKGGFISDWVNKLTNNGVVKLNQKLGKENAKSILELGRNAAYGALEVTDNPWVKENFISRLGSYCKAKGIKNIDDIPEDALNVALEESLKATYKDNSWLVKGIRKLKGATEDIGNAIAPRLGDMASQAVIPYVQAPGNIGARVIDYSPLGAAKSIGKIISNHNDPKMVREGIEELSKGLSGTLMAGLGMALYKSGLITGTESEDPDQRAFERQNGFREFALRLVNPVTGKVTYETFNWMQPFSDVIMSGVLLQQAIDEADKYDNDILRYFGLEGTKTGKALGAATETAKKEVNYFFDATPLKNFGDLFKSSGYGGDTDIAGNLWSNTVEDFASAMLPAQVKAIAKTVDPIQRQTTDPNNKFATFVNGLKAGTPGLSKTLPVKYDNWGQPMTYGDNSLEAGVSKLLYPGEHVVDSSDDVDKEISRIFEGDPDNGVTGVQDSGVFPLNAPNSVDGVKLTAQQKSDYQHDMGVRSREIVESFMGSDIYQTIPDYDKSAIIKNFYGTSKAITERDLFNQPISEHSPYKKAIDIYDEAGGGEAGAKAVADFYSGKQVAKEIAGDLSASSNTYKAVQEKVEQGDIEGAEQTVADNDYIKQNFGEKAQSYVPTLYLSAKEYNPDLTVQDYVSTYKAIDALGNRNEAIDRDEIVSYLNRNKIGSGDGQNILYTYGKMSGKNAWKQVPHLDYNSKTGKTEWYY